MNELMQKKFNTKRRANRVRTVVSGTASRPRLNVNVSLHHITAQLIDDDKSATLAYASTVGSKQTGTMTEKAAWVGAQIAAKAKKVKIAKVVMDRGPKKYHGRIKSLADAAREGGLEF